MSPRSKYVPENETQLSTENDMSKRLDKAEDDQIKHDMQREFTADDFTPVEFLSQCLALAEEREYRDKWNEYTFAEKFDRKPTEEEITQALNMGMEISVELMDWLHRYWRESKKREREIEKAKLEKLSVSPEMLPKLKTKNSLSVIEMAQQIRSEMGEVYAASLGRLLISKTQYLVKVRGRKKHKTVAHLWNGADTLCGIYSRDGLDSDTYEVMDSARGKRICTHCERAAL